MSDRGRQHPRFRRRLWSHGPVSMRPAGPVYASIDAAAAEVEAAHRAWLTMDRDAWRAAIGVLRPSGSDEG